MRLSKYLVHFFYDLSVHLYFRTSLLKNAEILAHHISPVYKQRQISLLLMSSGVERNQRKKIPPVKKRHAWRDLKICIKIVPAIHRFF